MSQWVPVQSIFFAMDQSLASRVKKLDSDFGNGETGYDSLNGRLRHSSPEHNNAEGVKKD